MHTGTPVDVVRGPFQGWQGVVLGTCQEKDMALVLLTKRSLGIETEAEVPTQDLKGKEYASR